MTQSYNDIIQQIAEIITDTVQKALASEGEYDRTYTAFVVEKIGANKYTVEYNGGRHTARSNISLSAGDMVMVCSPCNNDAALFVVTKVS